MYTFSNGILANRFSLRKLFLTVIFLEISCLNILSDNCSCLFFFWIFLRTVFPHYFLIRREILYQNGQFQNIYWYTRKLKVAYVLPTIFLDVRSRNILWIIFLHPTSNSSPRLFPSYPLLTLLLYFLSIFYLSQCAKPDFPSIS